MRGLTLAIVFLVTNQLLVSHDFIYLFYFFKERGGKKLSGALFVD